MRSAPACAAASASAALVIPQILTRIMVLRGGRRGAEQIRECRAGIGSQHQPRANQKGVEAGLTQLRELRVAADAGLADRDALVWNARNQLKRGLDADVECLEIAIVYADDARVGCQSAIEFLAGVDFDE